MLIKLANIYVLSKNDANKAEYIAFFSTDIQMALFVASA